MRIGFIKFFICAFIILFAGYAYGLMQKNPQIGQVHAQSEWGPSCPNATYPNNSFPNQCPAGRPPAGGAICATSSNFNVTIDGNIPIGQKFVIDIEPVNGQLVCSDVTCLKRNTTYNTPDGYNGISYNVTLDQIGCSGAACDNNYMVTAVFAEPFIRPELNCPNPAPWTGIIHNGTPNDVHFTINCETLPTPTPVPPTATPTPTTPPGVTPASPPTPTNTPSPTPTTIPPPPQTVCPTVPTVIPVITCPNCQ